MLKDKLSILVIAVIIIGVIDHGMGMTGNEKYRTETTNVFI